MNSSPVSTRRKRSTLVRSIVLRLAMILGIATASMVFAPTAAHAEDYSRIFTFQNWATGRCLDANSGGAVYTRPCQGGNVYQQWRVSALYGGGFEGHDRVRLQNRGTGQWLNISLTRPSTVIGSSELTARGPDWGNVQFVSLNANPGRRYCLDSDHTGTAYAGDCNFGGYQTWRAI